MDKREDIRRRYREKLKQKRMMREGGVKWPGGSNEAKMMDTARQLARNPKIPREIRERLAMAMRCAESTPTEGAPKETPKETMIVDRKTGKPRVKMTNEVPPSVKK